MKRQTAGERASRSRRVDLRPNPPSLVVAVPDAFRHTGSVNEVAHVEIDRQTVAFRLIDRDTAFLTELPAVGSVVSLFHVFPADWCVQVLDYLRNTETDEEFQARLSKPTAFQGFNGSMGNQATKPLPDLRYGLQAPNHRTEGGPR